MKQRRKKCGMAYSTAVMGDPILRRFCVDKMAPSEIDRVLGKSAGTAHDAIVTWWYDDMMKYAKGWSL